MDSSASSRTGWFRAGLQGFLVLLLVVAAFFGGWSIEQRRMEKSVGDAQEAADAARRQLEQTTLELALERAKHGLPPPPLSDEDSPQRKSEGRSDLPPP